MTTRTSCPSAAKALGSDPTDIRQPAGLGEGGHFGAEHENLQPLHVASSRVWGTRHW